MADYIAASVHNHCADGWTCLSRAVEALAKGDRVNAIHLGYYAELRAAMSLLGSQGVAVLDQSHVALDQKGNPHPIRGMGTHQFVWRALKAWGKNPRSVRLDGLSTLPVAGVTFAEWLSGAGARKSIQHLIQAEWLRAWGLDIKRMAEDRDLRNKISYEPTTLTRTEAAGHENCLEPLTKIWHSLEPGGQGSFPQVDSHLLRLALEKAFESTHGRPPEGPEFVKFVDKATNEAAHPELKGFYLREVDASDAYVLRISREKGTPDNALPTLGRAVLLLRVASAVCLDLLCQGGFADADLAFWSTRYGEDHGIWERGSPPEQLMDLWADIDAAIGDARAQLHEGTSIAEAWSLIPTALTALCQYQRAGLWSLTPA